MIIGSVIAAASASEAGLAISSALGSPSGAQPSTTPTTTAPTPVNPQTVQAAVTQQIPTLQSQVGGALSPEYYLQQALLQSGQAGGAGAPAAGQQSVNQAFGFNPAAAIASLVPGYTPAGIGTANAGGFVTQDLSDLMRKAFGG